MLPPCVSWLKTTLRLSFTQAIARAYCVVLCCTSSRTVVVHVRIARLVQLREKITYWYDRNVSMCMFEKGYEGLETGFAVCFRNVGRQIIVPKSSVLWYDR
jgi:hypothetical protein